MAIHSTQPESAYLLREAAERPRSYWTENKASISKNMILIGAALLLAGISTAAAGGCCPDTQLSDLAGKILGGGIGMAVAGVIVMLAGAYFWHHSKKSEEESGDSSRQLMIKAIGTFVAMITVIGISLCITGSPLDEKAALNTGITFSVLGGVSTIASIVALALQKQKERLQPEQEVR